MIGWLSDWAETIIIAVIIATIIEMILPEGSSKKYIKVVIGVYILFTISSPMINKFTGKAIAVSDIFDLDEYVNTIEENEINQNLLQKNNSTSIRDIYIGNLKADIQNKLKAKGYNVISIDLDVGYDDNYTLNQINLSITKKDDNEENTNMANSIIEMVNEINISVSNSNMQASELKEERKSNISNHDKNEIKEYLSSVYEINEKNIMIE